MTTTKINTSGTQTGKLITSHQGRCRGPRYGEVYTAPAGHAGYVSGRRNDTVPGRLMDCEWHATQAAAQDRAVTLCDQ